jgi:hypothetical protein
LPSILQIDVPRGRIRMELAYSSPWIRLHIGNLFLSLDSSNWVQQGTIAYSLHIDMTHPNQYYYSIITFCSVLHVCKQMLKDHVSSTYIRGCQIGMQWPQLCAKPRHFGKLDVATSRIAFLDLNIHVLQVVTRIQTIEYKIAPLTPPNIHTNYQSG